MDNKVINSIVECMASNKDMSEIQRIQTEHRYKLVQFWGIEQGSRVLEIGCGQGDTTAVLAYFVGESGFVHGIDIGSPEYGSPITIGDSAEFLKNSKLGKQIKMEYEVDLLSPDDDFSENLYDYIVFSHCSWYLKSAAKLNEMLIKVRRWGKQLCFAEWDTRISTIEQYPHLLSILIQAQYESFKQCSDSNIRTLFTPEEVMKSAEHAGWNIEKESVVFSPELQDGQWEVDLVLTKMDNELKKIEGIPVKLEQLIQSEVVLLEGAVKSQNMKPLSVFAFLAK